MGNEQASKQLKIIWQQDSKDHNLFRNIETKETVKRIFIDASSLKQHGAFKKRIEDNNQRACKIVYHHNSNTGLNLICAYVEELQHLDQWNSNNVLGILKGMKQMINNYGYFKVTAEMIRKDRFQRIKVWCNKDISQNFPQFIVENQGQMFSSFLIVLKNRNKQIYKQIECCDNFNKAIELIINNWKSNFKNEIDKKEHNTKQFKKLFVEPKIIQRDKERFSSLLKFNKTQQKKYQLVSPKFLQNDQKIQGLQLIESKSIFLKSTQNLEDENYNDRIKSQSNLSHFKKSFFVRQINEYEQNCEQQYNSSSENIKEIEQLQAGLQKLKNNLKKEERLTKRKQKRGNMETNQQSNLVHVQQKRARFSNLLAKVKSIPMITNVNKQKQKNKINTQKRHISPPAKLFSPPKQFIPQRNFTSDFNQLKFINKKNFCPHQTLGAQKAPPPTHRKSDLHLLYKQRLKEDKIKQKIQAKNQFFAELKLQACKILD